MITLEDKPILKIIKKFDKTISLIILGETDAIVEHKNIGDMSEYIDFINKNSNDGTAFLLQLDDTQWVSLSKENWIK